MTSYERKNTKQFRILRQSIVAVMLVWSAALSSARADTASGLADFRTGQFSEAVSAWRAAAEQGDAAAALYLGVLYDTGFGVAQSPADALGWYERGGARGNVTAMFNAAVMYDSGRGTQSDPAAALRWYEQASRAGSGRADYDLGLMYENGAGAPRNRARAIRFFREAVAHGVSEGRAHLARMGMPYAGAVGQNRPDPAMTNFQQAQRALLARGPDGDAKAATLFRKAADGGDALAAYNLGYCYEHGIGVAQNVDQALVWYRRSATAATDPALREIALSGESSLMSGVSQVHR